MADAMVTARVPRAKKEAGNRILEKLGTNASQAINDLYDYVLENEALPFGKKKLEERRLTEEQIAEMREFIRSMPEPPEDLEFDKLSEEEIRQRRYEYLIEKHGGAWA